jgi:hypothetical protein
MCSDIVTEGSDSSTCCSPILFFIDSEDDIIFPRIVVQGIKPQVFGDVLEGMVVR